jgi:hypothetical protein
MKLFNRTKKEEQNNTETKKENKVLKFVRNHAIGLAGGAIMIVTIAAIAAANSDDNAEETDPDDITLDNVKSDEEFGQPRYDVGIDDAFATVAYSDGDVGFVGKDYIMNLAERIAELRNEEEES